MLPGMPPPPCTCDDLLFVADPTFRTYRADFLRATGSQSACPRPSASSCAPRQWPPSRSKGISRPLANECPYFRVAVELRPMRSQPYPCPRAPFARAPDRAGDRRVRTLRAVRFAIGLASTYPWPTATASSRSSDARSARRTSIFQVSV